MSGDPITMDLSLFAEAQVGIYVDLAMTLHLAGIIDAKALAARLADHDNPIGRVTPDSKYIAEWASRTLLRCVNYHDAQQSRRAGDDNDSGTPVLRLVPLDGDGA